MTYMELSLFPLVKGQSLELLSDSESERVTFVIIFRENVKAADRCR